MFFALGCNEKDWRMTRVKSGRIKRLTRYRRHHIRTSCAFLRLPDSGKRRHTTSPANVAGGKIQDNPTNEVSLRTFWRAAPRRSVMSLATPITIVE